MASALSLLVALVAAEIFLRLLYPCPWYGYSLGRWHRELFRYDATLGWTGRPADGVLFASKDFAVRVHHDAQGHRSRVPPHDPERESWLVLGDSNAWGWGVAQEEIFADRMMARDPTLHVYNLAAPGYGPDQQHLALLRYLERHPQARLGGVLVVMTVNDFLDVQRATNHRHPKPHYALGDRGLELRGVPVPADRASVFDGRREYAAPETHPLRRFHVFNLLDRGLPLLLARGRAERASGEERAGIALIRELVAASADAAASRGGGLAAALLRARGRPAPWDELSAELTAEGIPVVHFHERAIPATNQWQNRHLSARGHRLLAEQLRAVLPEARRAAARRSPDDAAAPVALQSAAARAASRSHSRRSSMSSLLVPEFWVALVAGLAVGAIAMRAHQRRRGAADRERAQQLAVELEQTRKEIESQRHEVAQHFARTSDLFRDLTEQYTQLYGHLAAGARAFCADEAPALAEGLDAPLLGADEDEEPSGTAAPAPASEPGGEPAAADAAAPSEAPPWEREGR